MSIVQLRSVVRILYATYCKKKKSLFFIVIALTSADSSRILGRVAPLLFDLLNPLAALSIPIDKPQPTTSSCHGPHCDGITKWIQPTTSSRHGPHCDITKWTQPTTSNIFRFNGGFESLTSRSRVQPLYQLSDILVGSHHRILHHLSTPKCIIRFTVCLYLSYSHNLVGWLKNVN